MRSCWGLVSQKQLYVKHFVKPDFLGVRLGQSCSAIQMLSFHFDVHKLKPWLRSKLEADYIGDSEFSIGRWHVVNPHHAQTCAVSRLKVGSGRVLSQTTSKADGPNAV